MNKKTLYKLEFDKIINMLTEHASSPGGKQACQKLKPMTDIGPPRNRLPRHLPESSRKVIFLSADAML